MPDNYSLSLRRLQPLKCRLSNNKSSLHRYDQVFQRQLKENIIEEIKLESEIRRITYLPHKEFIKSKSSTTKVRIISMLVPKRKME